MKYGKGPDSNLQPLDTQSDSTDCVTGPSNPLLVKYSLCIQCSFMHITLVFKSTLIGAYKNVNRVIFATFSQKCDTQSIVSKTVKPLV